MNEPGRRTERGIDVGKFVTGVLLVTFGVAFLSDRLDWVAFGEIVRWWPLWLIAIGVSHVLWPRRGRGRLAGFWPILIGVLFLLDITDTIAIGDSWPLFIVGAGLLMVLRAMGIGQCARVTAGEQPQPQVRP